MNTPGQTESPASTGTGHPGRRQILTAAGAGLVAAAGLGGTAAAAPAAGSRSAVAGGWLVTRHDSSTPLPIRSVLTFSDGGASVGLDIEPTAPPYAGTWKACDGGGFAVTYWSAILDDSGVGIGTARIRATGRVRDDRMTGSYTGVVFLGDQQATGSGTFQGVRIAAD